MEKKKIHRLPPPSPVLLLLLCYLGVGDPHDLVQHSSRHLRSYPARTAEGEFSFPACIFYIIFFFEGQHGPQNSGENLQNTVLAPNLRERNKRKGSEAAKAQHLELLAAGRRQQKDATRKKEQAPT